MKYIDYGTEPFLHGSYLHLADFLIYEPIKPKIPL